MTRVVLHDLAVRPETADEYVVGRADTGAFVLLPRIGVDAIEALRGGRTVEETSELTGADIAEFVEQLRELGFVRSIDERLVSTDAPPATFPWLRPGHVAWLFSRPAQVAYVALLAAAVWSVATDPSVVPSSGDFFWSRSPGLVMLVNFVLFVVLIAGHELAHLVAARSLGAPARVTLGTRLHHLVVQTDVSALWAVPRRQRSRAYLAGLMWDGAAISAFVLLARLEPVSTFFQAAALMVIFGVVQQLCLYMRTDLYFVVQDALRCGNLFEDALAYLRYRTRRTGDDPSASLDPRERRVVRVYAVVVAVGSTLALAIYAAYGIPILATIVERAAREVGSGDPARMADGAASLGVEALLIGTFVVTFVRTHPRIRLAWPRGSVMGATARRG